MNKPSKSKLLTRRKVLQTSAVAAGVTLFAPYINRSWAATTEINILSWYGLGEPDMVAEFDKRRKMIVPALNALPGFRCADSAGAFYAFPDVREAVAAIPGVNDDLELATWLLEEAGVAVVPGKPFGAPGFVRLSFATSIDVLQAAIERMRKALSQHI